MKKTILWILVIVVIIVCAALVGGYIILSNYDVNRFKPQIVKAVKDATGRELAIAGDIDLDIGFTPAVLLDGIRFQNAAWGSRPDMVSIKRIEVQVSLWPLLSGRIDIKRFILIDADILVESDPKGNLNIAFETKAPSKTPSATTPKKEPEAETALPAVSFDHIEVKNSRFAYRDGRTKQTTAFLIKTLNLRAPGFDQPVQLAMESSLNDADIIISGNLGPMAAAMDAGRAWPIKVDIKALGTTLAVNGTIQDTMAPKGIAMNFDFQLKDPKPLEAFLKTTLPAVSPLKVSGKITDSGPKAYQISALQVTAGDSIIKGQVGLDLAQKQPKISADLSADTLDLRPFMQKAESTDKKASAPKAKAAKAEKVFPDDPLPLDALNAVAADIKFKAAKMLLPKLALAQVQTRVLLQNGALSLRPLKAKVGGGDLDGALSLTPKGKAADLLANLKIVDLAVGTMVKDAELPDSVTGNLNVDLDLKGRGASVAKLMAGLNGHVSMILGDGRIHNKYLNLLGGDLATGALRMLNPAHTKKDYTVINCLVTRFDVKKGIAGTTVMLFDTESMNVVGNGDIDLRTEKLDLSLEPNPKEGLAGSKIGISLGELAKPFKLGGTLASPSLGIDTAKAALAIGKSVGGMALLGPVGVASALVGSSGDKGISCEDAVAAAKSGVPVKAKAKSSKPAQKTETKSSSSETLPDLGNKLKGLFGK